VAVGGRRAVGDYLRPARRDPISHIAPMLLASGLFVGRRAIGVEYRQGEATRLPCEREVIVAGGTFKLAAAPQLSGLGPESLLRSSA